MKSNIAIDMGKFWVSSYGPKCCQPIKLQGSLKCNIVRKKCMMKFIFCIQINVEIFCKAVLSFWLSGNRHAQSSQSKFAYLLQYLHRSIRNEVDFLTTDKHKSFLQDDSITLGERSQTSPKNQKQPVYNIFAISPETNER